MTPSLTAMPRPPLEPMLARPLGHLIPEADAAVAFEPKWDGFRCLAFRDADGVTLQGRGRGLGSSEASDLGYAFPELVAACLRQLPPGTIADGEIVIAHGGRLDFGVLTSRLRPRSEAGGPSINKLADRFPASLLVFDLLWSGGDLMARPLRERRRVLTELSRAWSHPLLLSPQTQDPQRARTWFVEYESAGVDGLMVKPLDDPYAPGARTQGKVKHRRTADVVVAGWRPHAKPGADGRDVVGSLLLGLHDATGALHYVGVCSAFTAVKRAELVDLLAPLSVAESDPHPWRGREDVRIPGQASRWKKEQPWRAVRPDLVAEVAYDQLEGDRFRHVAGFVRWRPDRAATSCGSDQLERPPEADIAALLSAGT